MASAATSGPPPFRADGAGLGGPVEHALNGAKLNRDGASKIIDRIYPHIDDLVAVRPDVNIQASIRKLLANAEAYSKQADTNLDFRRPDRALSDYIKASIITLEIIPRHKEYPDLRADRGDLRRQWDGMMKRITVQHERFEKVKMDIKENNVESGVQPAVVGSSHAHTAPSPQLIHKISGHPSSVQPSNVTQSKAHDHDHLPSQSIDPNRVELENTPPSKKRPPPVQRKPDALIGKTIKEPPVHSATPTVSHVEDLAARFARLRGAESPAPIQDPRIRTRPIIPPASVTSTSRPSAANHAKSNSISQLDRPLGPRDMPQVPSTFLAPRKLPLDTNILLMPRPPDAIYSPSRGSENDSGLDHVGKSQPRTSFGAPSRTNSVASTSNGLRTSITIDERADYFSPVKSPTTLNHGRSLDRSSSLELPDSSTVGPEDLMRYLQKGYRDLRLLLVDIRSREQFDSGHIMCQSIICIEPITLQEDMSGDDVGQTMVLAPEAEQDLFEKRHEFDLVVYYDQSSTLESRGNGSGGNGGFALRDFSRAVYEYSYDKKLARRPVLLDGGLDAWIDLVGRNALKSSTTAATLPLSSGAALRRTPARARQTRALPTSRRRTYESRPLTKEEESKWDETLKEEAVPSPTLLRDGEAWYAKTTGDFFARFPEVSVQESMVVPRAREEKESIISRPQVSQPVDARHHQELDSLMPRQPTRPTPAVPRPSYSGISERAGNYTAGTSFQTEASSDAPTVPSISQALNPNPGRTGLHNFGNTCYMNSVLQCLSATTTLARHLMTGAFEQEKLKPRRRTGETTDPPQLMARNLANLLRHLWSGQFTYVTPKTFRDYVRAVHCRDRTNQNTFGGQYQQDASEFLTFVLEMLDDEMNPKRSEPRSAEPSPGEMVELVAMPPVLSAMQEWLRFSRYESSIINTLFGGQYTTTTTCKSCGYAVKRWDTWQNLPLPITRIESKPQSLQDVLRQHFEPEHVDDYICDRCKKEGAVRSMKISRCPNYMIIDLKRAQFGQKLHTQVNFPLDKLDMRPYFVDLAGIDPARLPREWVPPFMYECYAIIQHKGETVNSGHYWALIRDFKDPNVWWRMNDDNAGLVQAYGPPDGYNTQTKQSYILFYRRSK